MVSGLISESHTSLNILPLDRPVSLHSCDGKIFDVNCDGSRKEKNIAGILESAGQIDLLEYMDTYWKDIKGDDNDLWSHEWNKHGTCMRYDQGSLANRMTRSNNTHIFPTARLALSVSITISRR